MNLLTVSDWAEFRSTLTDVKDTFLKMPVNYVQRGTRTLNPFHEHRKEDLTATVYALRGLKVERSSTDSEAKVMENAKGFMDNAEGYVLFDYQYLQAFTPTLINADGRSIFIPNKDTLVCQGEELTIIGVDLVGPTEADFQLVKVHYKKVLSNNEGVPT